MATLDELAEIMNHLPEVRWDRCTRCEDGGGCAYGWIDRDDGRADFFLLRWDEQGVGWTTSSAKYSREFSRRLKGDDETHVDCQRVEDVFGGLVRLRVARTGPKAA